jgi:LysR family glycine cleavage system transcriptional activator
MLDSGGLKLMHAARVETGTYSFAVGRNRASARVDAFTDWLEERGGV